MTLSRPASLSGLRWADWSRTPRGRGLLSGSTVDLMSRSRYVRRARFSFSLLGLWVIVGIIVAAANDYFDGVNTWNEFWAAVLAVLAWPLPLFGADISVR
jgi:hypothetical protein